LKGEFKLGNKLKFDIPQNADVIPTNMGRDNGKKDWGMKEALRELIGNAYSKPNRRLEWKDGLAIISDDGPGMKRKHFILGNSSHRDSDTELGVHGEGTKMALNTACRENRAILIETKGFCATARFEFNDGFDDEVMTFHFWPNKKKSGTKIMVEATKKEFDQAMDMFLEFADLKELEKGIYSPGGWFYIMDLRTSKINTLFSYNECRKDAKKFLNRDRNYTDINWVHNSIENCLADTKSESVILGYLTGYKENSTALEYSVSFTPRHKDKWEKVIKKHFAKAVLSSGPENDLPAKCAGYEILRELPGNLRLIMKRLGIPESNTVARKYQGGKGIINDNKIIYPISGGYCRHKTVTDAICELLSNAISASSDVVAEVKNGDIGRIVDKGEGFKKKHLIIGEGKADDTSIGMFHEGLKVAALVFAREKRNFICKTAGFEFTATLEKDTEFDAEILVFHLKKNKKAKGTEITFKCSSKEMTAAKKRYLMFNQDLQKVATDVYLPGGQQFVLGVFVQQKTALFSYNLNDKYTVIGRDRNALDMAKFEYQVKNMLTNTTSEAVIKRYLQCWKKEKNAFEYGVSFRPKYLSKWKEIAAEILDEAVISTSVEADVKAKYAGHTVIRNAPGYFTDVLRAIGVKTSDEVAKEYKGGIENKNKIYFPLTAEYCRYYEVKDAIPEAISNALDTKTKCSITWNDGLARISDQGSGLKKKDLLFGGPQKENDQIGMFNEGLKIMSLVMARAKREMKVDTVGWSFTAELEKDPEFGVDVLTLTLSPNKRRKGTVVSFKCSKKELNEAKNKFRYFNKNFKEVDKRILEPGRTLFVNGVKICQIPTLFSYDIRKRERLMSRDRKSYNTEDAKPDIEKILCKTTSQKVIKKVMESFFSEAYYMEHDLKLSKVTDNPETKELWKNTMKSVFGKKTCLSSGNPTRDVLAQDKGYKVLTNMASNIAMLLYKLGMPYSSQVITLPKDAKIVKKRLNKKTLAEDEKWVMKKGLNAYAKKYGKQWLNKVEIVEEFNEEEVGNGTIGFYFGGTDKVYVLRAVLSWYKSSRHKNLAKFLGTLCHEHIHRTSGAPDCTRHFENALTEAIGELMADLYCPEKRETSKPNKKQSRKSTNSEITLFDLNAS
jgi:hypothetical protein